MIKDLALRSRHAQEERERSMHGVAGRTSHLHRAHVHSSHRHSSHVHSSHHGHSTHVHSSHHLHSTHGVTSVTSPQRRCVGRWGRGSGRRAFGRGRRRARTENEENGNGERFRDHRGGAPGEGGGVVSGAPSSRSGDLVGDTSVRSSATQTRAWRRAYARSGADVKNTQIQIAGRERSVGGTCKNKPKLRKAGTRRMARAPTRFLRLAQSLRTAIRPPAPGDHPAIWRHSLAHCRQASAHFLQCSCECLSHSVAQASQASAQRRQNCFEKRLPRRISRAASRQMSAQSRSSSMQSTICSTDFSFRQADAHCSQAMAHSSHALMQDDSWAICIVSPARVRPPSCTLHAARSGWHVSCKDTVLTPRGSPIPGRT